VEGFVKALKGSSLVALTGSLLIAGVTACGGGGDATGASTAAQQKTMKVAAVLIGPKNDQSFDQVTYEGILDAQKANPNVKLTATLENKATDQQRTDGITTVAPLNNVVVGVSASFGPIFDQLADKYPNTSFINVLGAPTHFHKNVYAFVPDRGAPAYVLGAIAAKLTKSKIVGYVGGAEIPPTVQELAGFQAGVKDADPSIKVLSNITGDFNDVGKAKAATAAMISDGADVLFPNLDSATEGTIAAAKDSGKDPAVFKINIPACSAYDNMVGTSLSNNRAATAKILSELAKGTAKPGAVFIDLQDPTYQHIALCPKYAKNQEMVQTVKDATDKVNSGAVKLPAKALNPRPDYPYQEGFDGKVHNAGGGA